MTTGRRSKPVASYHLDDFERMTGTPLTGRAYSSGLMPSLPGVAHAALTSTRRHPMNDSGIG